MKRNLVEEEVNHQKAELLEETLDVLEKLARKPCRGCSEFNLNTGDPDEHRPGCIIDEHLKRAGRRASVPVDYRITAAEVKMERALRSTKRAAGFCPDHRIDQPHKDCPHCHPERL